MKKNLIFVLVLVFVLVFVSNSGAQMFPGSYKLGDTKLEKAAAFTPVSNSILDIIVEDEIIWLGTSRGLSKSTDGGESWTNYYNTSPFGDESIVSIAYSNGIIYASTGRTREINTVDQQEGTGIKYSTDFGDTWQAVPQPLDNPGDSSVVYGVNTLRALPVTTAISNISFDIALTSGTIWITSFAGGLRKSTNLGQTWDRVVLPPDNLDELHPDSNYNFTLQPVAGAFGNENNLNHRVFSVVAANDTTIYVGTAGGINRGLINSVTGDITWKKSTHTNQSASISGNFITALGFDSTKHSVWAASWMAEGAGEYTAVSSSSNQGASWDIHLTGEKAHNFGFKYYLNNKGVPTSDVSAATDNGLFRGFENTNSWISPTDIIDGISQIPILQNVFFSVAYQTFNNESIVWLGSGGEGLGKLTESNGFWQGEWVVQLASKPLKNFEDTYAFPNPFSPNLGYTRIKYSVSNSSASVTIRIMDFGMNLVRTLIQNVSKSSGDQFEFWNGRDQSGSIVTNGVYFYRVDMDSRDPVFGKIMVIR